MDSTVQDFPTLQLIGCCVRCLFRSFYVTEGSGEHSAAVLFFFHDNGDRGKAEAELMT